MKITHVLTAVLGMVLAVQTFAEPRRGDHAGSANKPSGRVTTTPAAKPDENIIGKTPADKSVTWEYTVMVSPGTSLEELRKLKATLKKEGKLTWGKLDEPRFGVKTYLSENEIKGLSEKIAEVTPSEETNQFMITLKQNESWPALKKVLTENRMQVYHINGDVNRPYQIAVKTPNMPVGMIFAVMGKYIDTENGQTGVEEVK